MLAAAEMMMDEKFWKPLWMSLLAGLSTCIGAGVVFCAGRDGVGKGLLTFSLALAGSVMITVSVVSILPECLRDESVILSGYHLLPVNSWPFLQRCLSFGIGSGLYLILSKFAFPEPDEILGFDKDETDKKAQIPEDLELAELDEDIEVQTILEPMMSQGSNTSSNANLRKLRSIQSSSPQEVGLDRNNDDATGKKRRPLWWTNLTTFSSGSDLGTEQSRRAWRVAMLLFVSLAVHNFPEGLAVAASSMHSPHLGLTTTVAIALHNIPGIAIAVPCLAARPDARWLAFWLATLSGLAEPLGAAVALYCLGGSPAANEKDSDMSISMNNVLAFVAGIMIMVAVVELFPEATRHKKGHAISFYSGTISGVVLMIGSETYLES